MQCYQQLSYLIWQISTAEHDLMYMILTYSIITQCRVLQSPRSRLMYTLLASKLLLQMLNKVQLGSTATTYDTFKTLASQIVSQDISFHFLLGLLHFQRCSNKFRF